MGAAQASMDHHESGQLEGCWHQGRQSGFFSVFLVKASTRAPNQIGAHSGEMIHRQSTGQLEVRRHHRPHHALRPKPCQHLHRPSLTQSQTGPTSGRSMLQGLAAQHGIWGTKPLPPTGLGETWMKQTRGGDTARHGLFHGVLRPPMPGRGWPHRCSWWCFFDTAPSFHLFSHPKVPDPGFWRGLDSIGVSKPGGLKFMVTDSLKLHPPESCHALFDARIPCIGGPLQFDPMTSWEGGGPAVVVNQNCSVHEPLQNMDQISFTKKQKERIQGWKVTCQVNVEGPSLSICHEISPFQMNINAMPISASSYCGAHQC